MGARVLYIAGEGRSGSTLLEMMLAAMGSFFALGEVVYMWERGVLDNQLCSCGTSLNDCPFWGPLLDGLYGRARRDAARRIVKLIRLVARLRHAPLFATPKLMGSVHRGFVDELRSTLAEFYGKVYEAASKPFLVDSSKNPSYALVLAETPEIELYVVHLVRDPRAVAYSWTRKKVRPEISGRVEYMPRYSPFQSAVSWAYVNWASTLLRRRSAGYIRIGYEEMVADPKQALAAILKMTGMGDLKVPDVEELHVGELHSTSGNPVRFTKGPIRISLDDEWRRKMSARSRFLVGAVTFPTSLWLKLSRSASSAKASKE